MSELKNEKLREKVRGKRRKSERESENKIDIVEYAKERRGKKKPRKGEERLGTIFSRQF